ncbi:MAG: serine hydrolase [Parvularculaceae bacterium]|nr:serine hydrolase [Parvularculaceae bacterium]
MKLLISAVLGLAVCSGAAVAAEPAPSGLWVWADELAESEISLTLTESRRGWTATVGREAADVSEEEGVLTVMADEHTFVGQMSQDRSLIVGIWQQPATDMAYLTMETPVVLAKDGRRRWTATFAVQERPFHLFLDIFDDEDGSQVAALRNPERNAIERATRFTIEASGDNEWTLTGGRPGRQTIRELSIQNDGTLSMGHSFFEEPIPLRMATDAERKSYVSRMPTDEPATYVSPADIGDGWPIASAEELSIDPKALDAMVQEIANDDPRSTRPRMIHSVVAAYKGKLFLDENFYDNDSLRRHDTRSLAKVFGSMLVGALAEDGKDIDPQDTPIPALLAKADLPLDDPRKADITLAHLMTYSSGLDCDASTNSVGNEDNMWGQSDQPNFWLYTAQLPVLYDPGERYAYCSGSINLVGAAIRKASGMPINTTFDTLIAQPLSFGPYHWDLAPNGEAYLGGGVYVRPRDFLKIGQVYANGGTWQGERILNEAFVQQAITPSIAITPETTRMTAEDFSNNYFGGEQAYTWRIDQVRVGDETYPSYEATGNGGQIVVVIPDFDLVVAFTGGNYRMGYVWGRWRNEIVGRHIIPALPSDS